MPLNSGRLIERTCFGLFLLLALAGLSGCRSSLGLFLPVDAHPRVIAEARHAAIQQNAGGLDSTLKDLERQTPGNSRLLYLLESARLRSLTGQQSASIELFSEAGALFDEQQLGASITVTESLQSGLALVTNDRALPYQGQLHERLLLYTFQSLNHLENGDVGSARIELNKGLRDMRWGKDNLPELRRRADRQLAENGIQLEGQIPQYRGPAAPVPVSSSSDNALLYYLSGLLHQAAGSADRAEIDYRNALAYAPGSEPLLHALDTLAEPESTQARLVILQESGWVSEKVPFSLPVFIRSRAYTLSFPQYPDTGRGWSYPDSIGIGGDRFRLHPVLDVDRIARKALEEAFPAILLRQALRIVAKDQIQKEAREEDPWLGLAASVLSILSDYPDLRSWLSLPAVISLADLSLPPGRAHFPAFGDSREPLSITLGAGKITVLRVVSANGRVIKVDSFPIPAYTEQP